VDVVVIPSLWEEPFGKVAVEGLLNGKFVVCSSSGGLPEAAELTKLPYAIFEKGNLQDLIMILSQFLADPILPNIDELKFARNNYFIHQKSNFEVFIRNVESR
jgi:glycosyltransferase involved in cell wall biosynthesis